MAKAKRKPASARKQTPPAPSDVAALSLPSLEPPISDAPEPTPEAPRAAAPRYALDATKRELVLRILQSGGTRAMAAELVGCSPSTIRRTARRDPEFAQQLEQIARSHELTHLTHINAAGKEARYWRAAAWALERMYPERYAPRRPHTLSAEQIQQALEEFATAIVEEIADPALRERIVERLEQLAHELVAEDQAEGADDL